MLSDKHWLKCHGWVLGCPRQELWRNLGTVGSSLGWDEEVRCLVGHLICYSLTASPLLFRKGRPAARRRVSRPQVSEQVTCQHCGQRRVSKGTASCDHCTISQSPCLGTGSAPHDCLVPHKITTEDPHAVPALQGRVPLRNAQATTPTFARLGPNHPSSGSARCAAREHLTTGSCPKRSRNEVPTSEIRRELVEVICETPRTEHAGAGAFLHSGTWPRCNVRNRASRGDVLVL